jgi:hypothetical protein
VPIDVQYSRPTRSPSPSGTCSSRSYHCYCMVSGAIPPALSRDACHLPHEDTASTRSVALRTIEHDLKLSFPTCIVNWFLHVRMQQQSILLWKHTSDSSFCVQPLHNLVPAAGPSHPLTIISPMPGRDWQAGAVCRSADSCPIEDTPGSLR